jgi:hypothetical protein
MSKKIKFTDQELMFIGITVTENIARLRRTPNLADDPATLDAINVMQNLVAKLPDPRKTGDRKIEFTNRELLVIGAVVAENAAALQETPNLANDPAKLNAINALHNLVGKLPDPEKLGDW